MITKSIWYSGDHCIGIVQIVQDHEKDEYRQTGNANFKYYIGIGQGQNEAEDARHIADYGLPFDQIAGNALFGVC